MKRLVTNKRGETSYGPRWQNTESSSDSENDEVDLLSHTIATAQEDNKDQIQNVKKKVEVTVKDGELMYLAALHGDWVAAEVLLERDPSLAIDYITEEGDRALHVAAAMKQEEFAKKLVELVSPKDLELVDGRGYTACCYAAVSGEVELARVLLGKNPDLATLHGVNDTTPLYKAASLGKVGIVLHFLESTKIEDLSPEEWYDLLLLTIRRQLFAAAEKIVETNELVATMTNEEEGTALHLLARQDRFNVISLQKILSSMLVFDSDAYWQEAKPPSFNRLAHKLWDLMQKLEKATLLQLIKRPTRIVHDSAKAGHPELIIMLTRTFPRLIWDTDSNGYTVFHVAIAHRRFDVFSLVSEVRAVVALSAMSQDRDGNNILHLAAKLAPRARVRNPQSVILMQTEMHWFKWTERLAPYCVEIRNKDGQTPRELFSKEHKSLFEYSEMWMKSTADSLMLIATIFLTVVFAVAFTVPGGYDSQTGMPILRKRKHLQNFIGCQVGALLFSIISIVLFRSIIASTSSEEDFQHKLPLRLYTGLGALYLSLLAAVWGLLQSVTLVNPKSTVDMWFSAVIILLVVIYWIVVELWALLTYWPWLSRKLTSRLTLFTGDDNEAKKAWFNKPART